MTNVKVFLLPIALLAAPFAAHADDWREETGHRRYDRAQKEVFWDGNCRVEQRVNRNGDLMERRRCRTDGDEPDSRRVADDDDTRSAPGYRQPGRYAEARPPQRADDYRDQRRYEAVPAPVYRDEEPAVAPRLAEQVQAAPRPARTSVPLIPAPLKVAQASPKPAPARAPAAKPVLAAAPRPHLVARAAPVAKAPRPVPPVAPTPPEVNVTIILAQAPGDAKRARVAATTVQHAGIKAPLIKARAIVRTEPDARPERVARAEPKVTQRPASPEPVRAAPKPARRTPVAEPVVAEPPAKAPAAKTRVYARADAAPKPARAVAPAAPADMAARVVAKAEPASATRPVPVAAPVVAAAPTRKAAPVVKAAPAVEPAPVLAKAEPVVEAAAAPVKPKPAVKISETYPKSAWLVTLPPDEAKDETTTAPARKPAPPVKLGGYASNDRAVQDYVLRKSSDPYSNLK